VVFVNKTQSLWSVWLILGFCIVPVHGELLTISAVDVFSYDLQGSIPPNETRIIDVGSLLGASGIPYDVVGLGWDLTIDVFAPSWLSDASISFGNDPTFQSPQFVLVPALGFDFPALQFFSSGGVRDLTNWNGTGQDYSFEIPTGQLYLEFFESYDDYVGVPDAWYISPSSLTLEVVRLPEPQMALLLPLAGAALFRRRRRS
jgi:hypothetical protein